MIGLSSAPGGNISLKKLREKGQSENGTYGPSVSDVPELEKKTLGGEGRQKINIYAPDSHNALISDIIREEYEAGEETTGNPHYRAETVRQEGSFNLMSRENKFVKTEPPIFTDLSSKDDSSLSQTKTPGGSSTLMSVKMVTSPIWWVISSVIRKIGYILLFVSLVVIALLYLINV